jgi:starvation-inducible DNA-binding protein
MRATHLGLSDKSLKGSIDLLNKTLSNESILSIKTKKAHWDIVGPQFLTLHQLWDTHYEIVTTYVDEVAERVRMLGGVPIATAAGFLENTTLEEHPGEVASATKAVALLLADHEKIVRSLRTSVATLTGDLDDAGTADFLTGLLEGHEKMAWMLRSFLEGEGVAADGVARPVKVPRLA